MEDPSGQKPKPIAVKLRENLAYMRANGYSREAMDAEIRRAQEAIQREKAADMQLSGAEKVAATGSKIANGFSFGLFDEALGALGGDQDTQRYLQKQLERENPGLALGAEVLGGLAVPGGALKAAPKSASLLTKLGRVAAEGAIQGGLSGFGNAEGGLGQRAKAVGSGATAGAITTGAIAGVTRGAGRLLKRGGEALGLTVPNIMDDLAKLAGREDIQTARARAADLRARGLGDEAMVADVLPQGEGALRAAATANRDVRKSVDLKLRQRANRLANRADDRFSEITGTQRQSARKSVKEMADAASERAAPHYAAAEQEFNRAGLVPDEDLPAAIDAIKAEQQSLRAEQQQLRQQLQGARSRVDRAVPQEQLAPLGGKVQMRDNAQVLLAERDRAAAIQRLEEIGNRLVETDDLLARGAQGRLPRPDGGPDFSQVAKLPTVRAAVKRLRPRYGFGRSTAEDFKVLDQAYKDMGEEIRFIGDKMQARTATTDEVARRTALIRERRVLGNHMSSVAPSYGKGLESFAGDKAAEGAYKLGNQAKQTPSDLLPDLMGDLEPSEVPFFREGAAASLRRDVPNIDLGEYARFQDVLAPVATREAADTFKAVFGEDAYRQYVGELLGMAQLQRMKAGAGESTTIDKLIEQATANPDQLMGIFQSLVSGNPVGVVRNAIPFKALDRLRASRGAQQNADFLQRGGSDMERALTELEQYIEAAQRPGSRLVRGLGERLTRATGRQISAEQGKNYRLPNDLMETLRRLSAGN